MSNPSLALARLFAAAFAFSITLSLSPVARADEVSSAGAPVAAADAPQTARTRWYGWQTLSTDGAAALFTVLSATADGRTGKDAFGGAALGAYALGGPTVHAAHGRWGASAGSLALRVGTPLVTGLVGAVVGAALPTKDDVEGAFDRTIGNPMLGMMYGALAGAVVASGIDAALLARRTEAAPAPEPTARPKVRIAPTFAVTREGGAGAPSGSRVTGGLVAIF